MIVYFLRNIRPYGKFKLNNYAHSPAGFDTQATENGNLFYGVGLKRGDEYELLDIVKPPVTPNLGFARLCALYSKGG